MYSDVSVLLFIGGEESISNNDKPTQCLLKACAIYWNQDKVARVVN